MKILSALIAFCFTMNVFASTGSLKELETAIDDFQYSMTVEWDQKDQAFKTQQIDGLTSKVDQLFKKGLAVEDLNLLVEKRFHNSKVAEAVKLKLALLGNKVTPANVAQVLKDNSIELYQQGASWNGDTHMFIAIGVAVVAIIAIALAYSGWKKDNYECAEYAIADYCTDAYDCHGNDSEYSSGHCSYAGTRCGSYERCIKEVRTDI